MLLNFRDIHPRKKAYYYDEFVGVVVAKCKDTYSEENQYLVKIEDTKIIAKPWIGANRSDIPKKYQTNDGYWFFAEYPSYRNRFRMEAGNEEFEIE